MPFGGPNHEMRGWSKQKLRYLQSYLPQYRKATQKASRTYYIDGFAGPGQLPDEVTGAMVDGSPLISCKVIPSFSKCYFVELAPAVACNLEAIVRPYKHAVVKTGDANEVVPKILSTINNLSPTLVVLDPTGIIGQVKWSTIEVIAAKRTEVFVNFPYHMAVQRLLPNDLGRMTETREAELNPFLPPGWMDTYRDSAGYGRSTLCRRFLNLYRDSLKRLGFSHVFASGAFRTDNGLPLYYLIWAGKNAIGAKIAEHVFLRQFTPQTIRLFDVDDDNWMAN